MLLQHPLYPILCGGDIQADCLRKGWIQPSAGSLQYGYSPQQHPLRRGITHSLRTGSVCQRGLRPPLDSPSREAHLNMYLQNFLRLLSKTPPFPFTHLPTFPVRISYPNGYPNTRCITYHTITQKSKRCPTRIHAYTVLDIFYNKKVHQSNLYPNSFHPFAARLAGLQR